MVGLFQKVPPFEILIKCSDPDTLSTCSDGVAIEAHQPGMILWDLDQSTLEARIWGSRSFPLLKKNHLF